MARRVILVVCPDAPRMDVWELLVRQAGYLMLTAPTLERALFLLSKVRPAVVMADASLFGRQARDVANRLRAGPPRSDAPLLVLGPLAAIQQQDLLREGNVLVSHTADPLTILGHLEDLTGGPHPQRPRPHV